MVSVAAIIASGVNQDGRRKFSVWGWATAEAQVFWWTSAVCASGA